MKYYTEDHEWIEIVGSEATIGLSEYAVTAMGEVTFVELPEEGEDFIVGDRLGGVESTDTSSDIYAPISGSVSMVNELLVDEPQLLSESPEDKGWICRLSDFDTSDVDDMMNEEEYFKYVDTL